MQGRVKKQRVHTVAVETESNDGEDCLQGANRGVEVHHLVKMCIGEYATVCRYAVDEER